MNYEEMELPAQLAPFVRAIWRLSGGGAADERLAFGAMPDGCIELIHRVAGISDWQGDQPRIFAAGICTGPARLNFSGDADFLAVRLWPWSWNLIADVPAASFHDRWLPVDPAWRAAAVFESGDLVAGLLDLFGGIEPDAIGRHVLVAQSTGELAVLSGRNHRAVQRWFEREIGMPARRYFRLLRFQRAIENNGQSTESLAQEALALGYSDQAHMARDVRRHSGTTPRELRAGARGPFLYR